MKKILFLAIVFFTIQMVSAQDTTNVSDNTVYNTAGIEVKPEFPGGYEEFYKFIGANYNTPTSKDFPGGKVYVSFVIEKDGSLTDIRILRDIGYGTGKEAIRVLELCPKWLPGEQNGKKVRCTFSLPIVLQGYINDISEVDVKPEYPGGIEEFYKFVQQNYSAPTQKGLNGQIIIEFVIESDGSIGNISILKDIGYDTGKEAVKVIKKSKKWIPAQKDGKYVRVLYKIPITIFAVNH